MDAIDRMIRTVRDRSLFRREDALLLALSGGPDSTCLLHMLVRIRDAWGLRLSAFHVNHGLRDDESDEDERFVRDDCARLGVPFRSARVPIRAAEKAAGLSLQERARGLRAAALIGAMKEEKADRIVTGHNRDDRVETVLYHLFRGSGPRGLAGIPHRSGPFVRPLLDLPRAAIEEWLAREGIPSRVDRTNLRAVYDRNRIRLELIPAAERLLGRSVAGPIAWSAEILAEVDDYLRREAERWIERRGVVSPEGAVQAPAGLLAEAHPALGAEILRRLAALGAGGEGTRIRRGTTRRLLALAAAERDGSLRIPGGLTARVEGDRLFFVTTAAPSAPYEMDVEIDRPVPLPDGRTLLCRIETLPEGMGERGEPEPGESAAALSARLDADRAAFPLLVRNRRPGDRFRPLGAPGGRKLQDLFTDRKVPRHARDDVPLLVDREGILWAAGVEIADRARLTRSTTKILTVAILPVPNDT
ncbi:MAG: tRNA lysidine(34) synthetase TilS [Candidatus Eisenbacteria bacterium]|nr:tRNA lysidine(34) synthetase TilS [Candidatus Eisenbacteria bacterium]